MTLLMRYNVRKNYLNVSTNTFKSIPEFILENVFRILFSHSICTSTRNTFKMFFYKSDPT